MDELNVKTAQNRTTINSVQEAVDQAGESARKIVGASRMVKKGRFLIYNEAAV